VVHDAAEREEHRLTHEELTALADHLGHPTLDPHGDVIPTAHGEFQSRKSVPLTDWPLGNLAIVVHVEDEPGKSFRKAVAAGFARGALVRVLARGPGIIECETLEGRSTIPTAVAANIDVWQADKDADLRFPQETLASLAMDQEAEVITLSDSCTGFSRRRLLDLGFTAGARVRPVLSNVGDEAHAYEIRGSVIALRKELAGQVIVHRLAATPNAHKTGPDSGV
jgi:DtxR family Mn-dependent transcriptional regulator